MGLGLLALLVGFRFDRQHHWLGWQLDHLLGDRDLHLAVVVLGVGLFGMDLEWPPLAHRAIGREEIDVVVETATELGSVHGVLSKEYPDADFEQATTTLTGQYQLSQ